MEAVLRPKWYNHCTINQVFSPFNILAQHSTMSNLDKQTENSSNALPFSLNWKDILMIGLFLVGAGGIIYSIRETDKTAENGVSANLIEKVDNQQIAQVENPVVKESATTRKHTNYCKSKCCPHRNGEA